MNSVSITRAERGAQSREDLLNAALVAFAERGFPGVSIADLARDLGIAKATVLHHFLSKEKLYDAVLSRVAGGLEQLLDSVDLDPDHGPKGLADIASAYLGWAREHPEQANLLTRELLDNRERASRAERWHLSGFTDRITDLVRRGQKAGYLRVCDPALPVEMILGFAQFHVAARPTRPHLMGAKAARTYERRLDTEWARAIGAAFAT